MTKNVTQNDLISYLIQTIEDNKSLDFNQLIPQLEQLKEHSPNDYYDLIYILSNLKSKNSVLLGFTSLNTLGSTPQLFASYSNTIKKLATGLLSTVLATTGTINNKSVDTSPLSEQSAVTLINSNSNFTALILDVNRKYAESLANLDLTNFISEYKIHSDSLQFCGFDWVIEYSKSLDNLKYDLQKIDIDTLDFKKILLFVHSFHSKVSLEVFRPQFLVKLDDVEVLIITLYVHNKIEDIIKINDLLDEEFTEFTTLNDRLDYLDKVLIFIKPYCDKTDNAIYLGLFN